MIESSIANAADYADGLLTARKAKNILILLVLVMLLFQLALFFAARYKIELGPAGPADSVASADAVARPTSPVVIDFLKYLVGLVDFLGVVLPIVLIADLWLIASILLLGRLLGVSRLIAAFLWCVVLLALLFPWQAFLMNQTFTSTEFKIPGVLYTWSELVVRGRVHPANVMRSLLYWARFVGWPIVAIALLLMIQHQSGVGLRSALGEGSSRTSGDVGQAAA
ncbi:MAG: hypothetical protein ABSB74_18815 [Tepidisphaeraceae bacterium]